MQINKTKNKQKYKYPDGAKLRVGIVYTKWNSDITDKLLEYALDTLTKSKDKTKNINVVRVAGAVEIPIALHRLAESKKYDFLVALGCVIRGETPHFEYVCKMAQEGVLKVMIEDNISIGFGVLTTNNMKQAKERIHVGGEAVLAGLEIALMKF